MDPIDEVALQNPQQENKTNPILFLSSVFLFLIIIASIIILPYILTKKPTATTNYQNPFATQITPTETPQNPFDISPTPYQNPFDFANQQATTAYQNPFSQ